jgi:hypothetical protein
MIDQTISSDAMVPVVIIVRRGRLLWNARRPVAFFCDPDRKCSAFRNLGVFSAGGWITKADNHSADLLLSAIPTSNIPILQATSLVTLHE